MAQSEPDRPTLSLLANLSKASSGELPLDQVTSHARTIADALEAGYVEKQQQLGTERLRITQQGRGAFERYGAHLRR